MKIDGFVGKAEFLSLDYLCDVTFDDITYPSATNLFYAMKATDRGMMRKIARLSPKKVRQKMASWENEDWETNKLHYLEKACRVKFDTNPELKKQLIATGDAELINRVAHMDDWLGVRQDGSGKNSLGKVLMKIRKTYIDDEKRDKTT